jgi:hypothetical protein
LNRAQGSVHDGGRDEQSCGSVGSQEAVGQ